MPEDIIRLENAEPELRFLLPLGNAAPGLTYFSRLDSVYRIPSPGSAALHPGVLKQVPPLMGLWRIEAWSVIRDNLNRTLTGAVPFPA